MEYPHLWDKQWVITTWDIVIWIKMEYLLLHTEYLPLWDDKRIKYTYIIYIYIYPMPFGNLT